MPGSISTDNLRQQKPLTEVCIGELYFCYEYRIVSVRGQEIDLAPKEFDILSLLISNPRRVFTYEMIVDIIWHENYDFYSQRAIHHHISNINRKIRQICTCKKYIKSVYGVGYTFDI